MKTSNATNLMKPVNPMNAITMKPAIYTGSAMRKILLTGLVAAALGLASASPFAQPAPAAGVEAGSAGMAAQGGARQQRSPEQRAAMMKEMMARRAAELHDKLKLNANQEGAWKTYLQSMTPGAHPKRPDRAQLDSMTAPQRMEMHLERMKQHEAELSKRLQATKTFYATLTPEQQKVFNESVARGHEHHMGHHGHGHGKGHGQGRGGAAGQPGQPGASAPGQQQPR
ncbi:MAG: hypothetical protein JWP36_1888 [Paucimonas sp.]|nr:hypothetical protein [Paucimonas sp.]